MDLKRCTNPAHEGEPLVPVGQFSPSYLVRGYGTCKLCVAKAKALRKAGNDARELQAQVDSNRRALAWWFERGLLPPSVPLRWSGSYVPATDPGEAEIDSTIIDENGREVPISTYVRQLYGPLRPGRPVWDAVLDVVGG